MPSKMIQLVEPIYKKPVLIQDTEPDDKNVLWVDTGDSASDGVDVFPTDGTVGQVLTKTSDGQEWADNAALAKLNRYAPTAILISSSTTNLPDVVDGAILIAYDA